MIGPIPPSPEARKISLWNKRDHCRRFPEFYLNIIELNLATNQKINPWKENIKKEKKKKLKWETSKMKTSLDNGGKP